MSLVSPLGAHRTVMAQEVVELLAPRSGGRYVDATLGEGGHAEPILEACAPRGELLGLDWDADALAIAGRRLERFGARVRLVRSGFGRVAEVLDEEGWGDGVDGMIVDLGVSTWQVGAAERGFSFRADGPLDMRMDQRRERSAEHLVAEAEEDELARTLARYGEEPRSRRIARAIVRRRDEAPIRTTGELAAVVHSVVPRRPGQVDPATRTFQALRIAVNEELEQIESLLAEGWRLLRPGGRLAVLSYHSLEDRLVKRAFAHWSRACLCPPGLPVCACGWTAKVRPVVRGRRPPSAEEIESNPRSRSAGLRVVERLEAA